MQLVAKFLNHGQPLAKADCELVAVQHNVIAQDDVVRSRLDPTISVQLDVVPLEARAFIFITCKPCEGRTAQDMSSETAICDRAR